MASDRTVLHPNFIFPGRSRSSCSPPLLHPPVCHKFVYSPTQKGLICTCPVAKSPWYPTVWANVHNPKLSDASRCSPLETADRCIAERGWLPASSDHPRSTCIEKTILACKACRAKRLARHAPRGPSRSIKIAKSNSRRKPSYFLARCSLWESLKHVHNDPTNKLYTALHSDAQLTIDYTLWSCGQKNYRITANNSHKPNTYRRRRRDETVESRRVGVGGVYWAIVFFGRRPLLGKLATSVGTC